MAKLVCPFASALILCFFILETYGSPETTLSSQSSAGADKNLRGWGARFRSPIGSKTTAPNVCNPASGFTCTKFGTCKQTALTHTCECQNKPKFSGFPCDLGPSVARKSLTVKQKELLAFSAALANQVYEPDNAAASAKCPVFKTKLQNWHIKKMQNGVNYFMYGTASLQNYGPLPFIVFRGTDSLATAVQDMKVEPKDLTIGGANVKVHKGFYEAISTNLNEIMEAAKTVIQGRTQVLISGHSLGGAMASLFTLYFHEKFPNVKIELVTYGKPRVGGANFARAVEASANSVMRVVNEQGGSYDIVPQFPNFKTKLALEKFWFIHEGPQLELPMDGNLNVGGVGPAVMFPLHSGDLYQRRAERLASMSFCKL